MHATGGGASRAGHLRCCRESVGKPVGDQDPKGVMGTGGVKPLSLTRVTWGVLARSGNLVGAAPVEGGYDEALVGRVRVGPSSVLRSTTRSSVWGAAATDPPATLAWIPAAAFARICRTRRSGRSSCG